MLYQIENSSHKEALNLLKESPMAANNSIYNEVTLLAPLYLLSTIINDFGDEQVESVLDEEYDYVTVRFRSLMD